MGCSFHLSDATTSYVGVEVRSRVWPTATDYWDANWLTCIVQIAAGPWHGHYQATLRANELAEFHDQLQRLHKDKEAPPAQFDSM